MENKRKEKITYVDDGRTVADMSNIKGSTDWLYKGTTSSFKDIWNTYWSAVRMMFRPMLVVIGFLCAIFLIAAIIFKIM